MTKLSNAPVQDNEDVLSKLDARSIDEIFKTMRMRYIQGTIGVKVRARAQFRIRSMCMR